MKLPTRTAATTTAALAIAMGAATVAPAPAAAQDQAEAVMTAAARWAVQRVPSGDVRLDPHRTGQDVGQATAERVARAIGATLGTLETIRRCESRTDPATCRMSADALLAVAQPQISGAEARIRVYAWHRGDAPREPVVRRSWDLRLTRAAAGWTVTGEVPRSN